jgi:arabinofuranosyltransferase
VFPITNSKVNLSSGWRPQRLVIGFLLLAAAVVVVRSAWVCDDAYITFRTIDNFYEGYGLRWNVAERVQSFTHPLWLLLVGAAFGLTGEPYFTSLALSVLLTLATLLILGARIASSTMAAVLAVGILLLSKGFVEYSASGLENPLSHLLIALFVLVYWTAPATARWVGRLSIITSLLLLTRLDLALLVVPALVVRMWRASDWPRTIAATAAGFLPLVLWELFSLVYYGFAFPNTAYAKLSTGTPSSELALQGMFYLVDSAMSDPLTLTAIAAACAVAWRLPAWQGGPLVLGVLLYLGYVVRIGGDFMSGRFLTGPLLAAVLVLARIPWPITGVRWLVPMGAVALAGLSAPHPAMPDGVDYGAVAPSGITDERRFYYWSTGLMQVFRGVTLPDMPWVHEGRAARGGPPVIVQGAIGFFSYFAGPSIFVIDYHGLADPLLARLPASARWRVGHFTRRIPAGYEASVLSDEIHLEDPGLAIYYRVLRLVTRGPLFSRERLGAVIAVNLGRYDHLLDDYAVATATLSEVAERRPDGTPWDAPGTRMMPERGLRITMNAPQRARFLDVSLSGNDHYTIRYLRGGLELALSHVEPDPLHDGSLAHRLLRAPRRLDAFDTLVILGRRGDYRYSLGHLRLLQ